MGDPQKLEEVKAAKAKYDETVAKVLTKIPERQAEFVNTSGIPIARVYTPLDMADFDYLQKLGMPGQYPYTRAVQPSPCSGTDDLYWRAISRARSRFGCPSESFPSRAM